MSTVRASNTSEKNGKTRFNRGKSKGESWITRRRKAIENGTWVMPKQGVDKLEKVW